MIPETKQNQLEETDDQTVETDEIETEEDDAEPTEVTEEPANEVVKFDITKAAIRKIQAHAETLAIDGPGDKEGLRRMMDFRLSIRDQRVDVEKAAKRLKRPHIAYNKAVDLALSAITGPMKEVENKLAIQEKEHKDEVERIAQEQLFKQQEQLKTRRNSLLQFGYVYDPVSEVYSFDDKRFNLHDFVSLEDMRSLPDEQFDEVISRASGLQTQQYKKLEEQQDAERKEAERVKAEKLEADKVEAARMKEINDRQEALQKENLRLENERKQLQDERDRDILDMRTEILVGLGAEKKGNLGVKILNIHFKNSELIKMTTDQFKAEVKDIKETIQKTEEKRIADEQEAERLKAEQLEKEQQQAREDEERQTRLAPEKESIKAFIMTVLSANRPETKEPETIQFMKDYYDEYDGFVQTQIELLNLL